MINENITNTSSHVLIYTHVRTYVYMKEEDCESSDCKWYRVCGVFWVLSIILLRK